jgi:hypothetical protein
MNTNIQPVEAEISVRISELRSDMEAGKISLFEYWHKVSELMSDDNSFVRSN